jgi:hypothetical protein
MVNTLYKHNKYAALFATPGYYRAGQGLLSIGKCAGGAIFLPFFLLDFLQKLCQVFC